MKKSILLLVFAFVFLFQACNDTKTESASTAIASNDGYESQAKWGEHLVLIAGCHDCHTPKKMTEQGPVMDFSLALSGHPEGAPIPDVNRKELQDKGLFLSNDLTTWIGPWGISYSANLTSDSTGTGTWKEEQFLMAIKEGKFKGLATGRTLLPPMPWEMIRNMTDDELKAIFAYLQTTKPIKNVVPPPTPPATN